jgi:hypothetical protein
MKQMKVCDSLMSEYQDKFQIISKNLRETSDFRNDQADFEMMEELFKNYDKRMARCSIEILEEEFFEVIKFSIIYII